MYPAAHSTLRLSTYTHCYESCLSIPPVIICALQGQSNTRHSALDEAMSHPSAFSFFLCSKPGYDTKRKRAHGTPRLSVEDGAFQEAKVSDANEWRHCSAYRSLKRSDIQPMRRADPNMKRDQRHFPNEPYFEQNGPPGMSWFRDP